MGYPNFGKVKTIVLPVDHSGDLSEEEYYEKFGIKLSDIFKIDEFDTDAKTFHVAIDKTTQILIETSGGLVSPNALLLNDYSSGENDGIWGIGEDAIDDAGRFVILFPKEKEFALANAIYKWLVN